MAQDEETSPPSKSDRPRRAATWLRHALFVLVFVAIPLTVYFAFYVEARVEQTTVRNFRALETAADSLRDVIENLPKVVGNVPVGVSEEGLAHVRKQAKTNWRDVQRRVRLQQTIDADLAKLEPTDQRMRHKLEAHRANVGKQIDGLVNGRCYQEILAIGSIHDDYIRDLEAAAGSKLFRVEPVVVRPEAVAKAAASTNGCVAAAAALLGAIGEQKNVPSCAPSAVTRRLKHGARGAQIEAIDCRPLSERSHQLWKALKDERLIEVLDAYGVGVVADLRDLMRNVTANVAPLFDEYVIADAEGRVLYTADEASASHARARLDFASQVELATLITGKEATEPSTATNRSIAAAFEAFGVGAQGRKEPEQWSLYGVHTRLQPIQVAGIGFQAFVHPFEIAGLSYGDEDTSDAAAEEKDAAGDPAKNEPAEDAKARPDPKPTRLFMVGIVSNEALDGESLALRLATVSDALLVISMLLVSLSLLWLWTAGERLVLGFGHFLMLIGAGMLATFVFTLFTLQLTTRASDAAALDASLRIVSKRLQDQFAEEVQERITVLAGETARMISSGRTAAHDEAVADLASGYACRPKDNAWQVAPPASPPYELAFLLDSEGLQWQCFSYRGFDTAPVKLTFRDYFQRPRSGSLWHLAAHPAPPEPAPSGTSLPAVSAGPPPNGDGSPPPTGYFLDRIVSILDGTTETVLAARTRELLAVATECLDPSGMDCDEMTADADKLPAAVVIGRMRSLEEAVLPPHVRFAVVDDATGRTLFHSVRSRALRTHFVRETGDDDTLLALIGTRSAGMVDIDYNGTPIRAYVASLEDRLPWTLITYREFELEDTLGVLTVATTAICVLGQFMLIVGVLLLLRFFLRRRLSDSRAVWRTRLLARASAPKTQRWLYAIGAFGSLVLLGSRFGVPIALGWVSFSIPFCALLTLVWAWRNRPQDELADEGNDVRRIPLSITILLLFATIAILPTLGWFLHYRELVSAAAAGHMAHAADQEILAKCERNRAYARRYKETFRHLDISAIPPSGPWTGIFDRGWLLASVPDSVPENGDAGTNHPAGRCSDFSRAEAQRTYVATLLGRPPNGGATSPGDPEERVDATVESWVATFSPLAEELAARSAKAIPAVGQPFPGALFENLLGPQPDERAQLSTLQLLEIGAVGALGLTLAYVVTLSLVGRILGAQSRLVTLRPITLPPIAPEPDPLPENWLPDPLPEKALPKKWRRANTLLRGCVIHQSEKDSRRVVALLMKVRFPSAKRAQWTKDGKFAWTASGIAEWDIEKERTRSSPPRDLKETLHIVDGFESFVADPEANTALLEALEQLFAEKGSLLVLSRSVPGYWLARITDETATEEIVGSKAAVSTMRWSRVIGPLDTRRLGSEEPSKVKARFEDRALPKQEIPDAEKAAYGQVQKALLREAIANPELFELAASVTRKAELSPKEESAVELAVQSFTVAAAGHFQALWATSTMEEQLQLYALARGGFANPTRTAVLSSLANRGLIETGGLARLKSAAFGDFIANDVIHDALLAWRDEGNGNTWRSIWPPVLLMVVLALAFFINSTPEALGPLTTVLVGGLGVLPVVGALLQRVRELKPSSGS